VRAKDTGDADVLGGLRSGILYVYRADCTPKIDLGSVYLHKSSGLGAEAIPLLSWFRKESGPERAANRGEVRHHELGGCDIRYTSQLDTAIFASLASSA